MYSAIRVFAQIDSELNNGIQGRSQDFVIGGAKRKFGGASLKNFKILNIGLINFYVMFKWKSDKK